MSSHNFNLRQLRDRALLFAAWGAVIGGLGYPPIGLATSTFEPKSRFLALVAGFIVGGIVGVVYALIKSRTGSGK